MFPLHCPGIVQFNGCNPEMETASKMLPVYTLFWFARGLYTVVPAPMFALATARLSRGDV